MRVSGGLRLLRRLWFRGADLPVDADVAVLGAGLAGTAVALYLARAGVSVAVVDIGDADGGFGNAELGVVEQPYRTVHALGPERAAFLFGWTARNKELLAAEGLFDPCGALWVALDAREAGESAKSAAALAQLGIAAEVLSARDVEARTGGTGFGDALWLPDDGRLVEGALQTLRDSAEAAGAVWVSEGEGPKAPEITVIAAGAHSRHLDPRLAHALVPVREQALRTAPVDRNLPGLGRAGQGYTSWRQHAGGGIEVSGCRWATPHLEVGETDASVLEPRVHAKLEAFAREHLGAGDAEVTARWAWIFAQTPDNLPLLGPLPGDARRVVCAGLGASPATFAMVAARTVADGIAGEGGEVPRMLSSRRLVGWRNR